MFKFNQLIFWSYIYRVELKSIIKFQILKMAETHISLKERIQQMAGESEEINPVEVSFLFGQCLKGQVLTFMKSLNLTYIFFVVFKSYPRWHINNWNNQRWQGISKHFHYAWKIMYECNWSKKPW